MMRLAVRNLSQGKVRLLMSTGGLALALLLVLALDGIWTGSGSRVSSYIDLSGADVWVAQAGVHNMHMASSTLPAALTDRVRSVPGVASVTPILYLLSTFDTGHDTHVAYVIGLPPNPTAGAPWRVVAGTGVPGPGETVIDRTVAESSGIGLGGQVTILKSRFRVVGLTEGTLSIINSIAFVSMADFARIRPNPDTVSYLLVKVAPGQSPDRVAVAIERETGNVSALSRASFSAEERKVIEGMSTDIVSIMNLVGLLIGLAVMGLSVYTSTLARRAEYGVLKAIGAGNRDLYGVVLVQAAAGLFLGLAVSILLTLLLSVAVPLVKPSIAIELSLGSVIKVASMAMVIVALAALLPVREIAGLDPAMVFRRKVS
jgi:putative ABC transport system permease protein